MRVGVLTTFYDFNSSYSLTSVVESQLVSLVKYGYKPVLFVHDNFNDDNRVPEGVEVRKVVPRFNLIDYSDARYFNKEPLNGFWNQVEETYQMFQEHFKDIDVIFEHDLIFQGWFLPYCVAIHKFANESQIKWFHWTHSVPNLMPSNTIEPHTFRFILPARSKLVYLNNFGMIRAAEAYQTYPKDVRIVYNPVDPRLYWNLHPFVKSLVEKYDLLSADFVQIYPVSSTRMVDGKQLPMLIDIIAKLKLQGKSVRLVVCNAHANDKREKQVIQEMMSRAWEKGLTSGEMIFTSLEEEPKWEHGVTREIVSQLFQFSNLFIFPTTSENCPLILLEAMMNKCILILNNNVGPLRELAQDSALYFNFGSIDDKITHNRYDGYCEDIAKMVISEYETNRPLRAWNRLRKNFNFDYIFKNQIQPLIHSND